MKRARKKDLLRKFQLRRGGFNEAEPGALANLQHQQDGWNDQAWIGDERKDLAQEGWKIIFNGLLDDVIHSVFPTGKKRTHYSMLQSSHGTQLCVCPSQSCCSALSRKSQRSAPNGLQIKMPPKGLPFWLGIIASQCPHNFSYYIGLLRLTASGCSPTFSWEKIACNIGMGPTQNSHAWQ